MIDHNLTDRSNSISSVEYVWDIDGNTEVHGYIARPILRILGERGCRSVLDLGCGNGSFTSTLARNGYEVIGVDVSRSGIARARRVNPTIMFEQQDLNEPLPPHHSCRHDAVVSVEVIEHMLLPRKLMQNAVSALKPGGVLVLTTPFHGYWKNLSLALTNKFDDHWHSLRDYGHVKFFSKKTILELFAEFQLTDLRFETVGRIPSLARSMIVTGTRAR